MTAALLPEALWDLVEAFLPIPPRRPKGGRPRVSDRACLTGIVFVLRSGIPWEMLPQELGCGCGMTCWRRLRDWQHAGIWDLIHFALLDWLARQGEIDWSRAVVDSCSVRTVFGGDQTGPNPTERAKRGSKRHVICDGRGVPLAVRLTGANRHDSQEALPLVDAIPPLQGDRGRPRCRPDCVLGDRAYDAERIRWGLRARHIRPLLAMRRRQHGSGGGQWRWVVERTFAWLNQFRHLRFRYDKRADIHEAFLSLGCALICCSPFGRPGQPGSRVLRFPATDSRLLTPPVHLALLMALVHGARLGPYEIITLVGAGGMGEVYKAKDTRLERTVAIKILPSALAADPEFRERFDREARTISQLSHPHICTLYDVGHQDGSDFLVMEFLDGESLADRLARSKGGPLPLQEAMAIAIQVADALDAAHRAGVVHRDLKPGNIILTAAGAKLVDFGLAKHVLTLPQATVPTGRTSLTAPPTVTSPLTIIGSIVGTLQYMSPEQLDGKEADARSDVFAFGAVLYEMLSGRRAFQGKTQVSVMAAIIEQDPPPLGSVDASYSAALTRVVQKCLAKEPQQRWQTVADLVDELRWIAQDGRSRVVGPTVTPEAVVRSVRRHRIAVAVAVAAAVGAGAIGAWAVVRVRQQPVPQPVRFSIVPPPSQPLTAGSGIHDIAISADGSHIVYRAGPAFDQTQLVVRDLNQLDGRFVGERGLGVSAPFFSPDAQWIGYAAGFDLKKVPTAGGAAITLTRLSGGLRGATWGPDDTIVFATSDFSTGLLSVPAGGGEPKTLTKPETNGGDHYFPSFLPNGRAVLFTIATGSANSIVGSQVAVLDLKTGQQKMLIRGGSDATYVADASTGGYLVYIAAASTLHAVRFDPDRLELRGDPVPIVEQVLTSPTGGSDYAVARNGTLVFVPGGRTFFGGPALPRSLVWVTRQGREEGLNAPTRSYSVARLSPDGKRVALEITDQETDIWTWDLTRRTLSRLTVDPAADLRPVWTPDGRRIIFTSARAGAQNLFWRASDGTGADERLTTSPNLQIPAAVTSDGTKLLVVEVIPGKAGDIVAVDLSPANATQPQGHRTSTSIITSSFVENNPELSPDNRWIAYQSNESGLNQVYVRPFPNTNEGLWQVSSGGGTRPLWSRSGRELFFLDGNNMLAAVPVETKGSTFSVGNAVKLLSTAYYAGIPQRTYDVTADGQRFLMIKDVPGDRTSTSPTINVVLNWTEELKQRVPTR